MEYRITNLMTLYEDDIIDIEDTEYLSVERVRQLTFEKLGITPPKKSRKIGRTILMGLAAALALSATAFAVYQFSIRDAVIDSLAPIESTVGMPERSHVSLNGFAGTPEFQAYAEWEAWNTNWTNNNPDWFRNHGVDDSYFETPENYAHYYRAYSQEQADKLDEIANNYGLTLHTARASFDTATELYDILGTDAFLGKTFPDVSGYVYDDGAFKAEGIYHPTEDAIVGWSIFNAPKGSFTCISSSLPAEYEEWSYVTDDGSTVLLVMTENSGAHILLPLENTYISVKLTLMNDEWSVLTAEHLESIADSIDFSVLAERFDTGASTEDITQAVALLCEAQKNEPEEEDIIGPVSPFSSIEEKEDTVVSILGQYGLASLPEGYKWMWLNANHVSEWISPVWWPEETTYRMNSVIQYYSKGGMDLTNGLELIYTKTYEDESMSQVRSKQDYLEMKSLYDQSESFREIVINGNEGYLVHFPNGMFSNTCVVWYDAEQELIFELSDSPFPQGTTDYSFSEEDMIAFAESVTKRYR